jgi:hypothetical protein
MTKRKKGKEIKFTLPKMPKVSGKVAGIVLAIALVCVVGVNTATAEYSLYDRIADVAGRIIGNKVADEIDVGEISLGAQPGPDFYNYVQFRNDVIYSTTNATQTDETALTMTNSDIFGYNNYHLEPLTDDVTVTTMSSSTLGSYLIKPGDTKTFIFRNATTSVVTGKGDVIFAAGTGVDIKTSSSTPSDLTIAADMEARLTFTKQGPASTTEDISLFIEEFSNAD